MHKWKCLLPAALLASYTATAYRWLLNQQSPSGLLGNQEDDTLSGVYANALAAICCLHQNNTSRGPACLRFFLSNHEQAATAEELTR
ncbi:MAG: hypothetical protein R6V06_07330 [Kiritimatiellia bacterium]